MSSRFSLQFKDDERVAILTKLRELNGNRTQTAKEIGMPLRTLRKRLQVYAAAGHDIVMTPAVIAAHRSKFTPGKAAT